ncbi:hypothetical protein [Chitinophaga sp. RAB17]|uniref:hypothetical protein n=1 Tax=Chitinophaga sp. RAB17 TaxID=3233049 RepID=UPI003F926381
MKRLLMLLAVLTAVTVNAQNTNLVGPTGNIGIGTINPTSKLQVFDNNRNYYVNRPIAGNTGDSQGLNYILLHDIYTGTPIADRHVMGKITGIRGAVGASNRKFTVEVNTASAYTNNRGSLISYNESSRLVTLVYNSTSYLALEIANSSMIYSFSFTGYAANETLKLAYTNEVTNVQPFTSYDPIAITGSLVVGSPFTAGGGASLIGGTTLTGGPTWTTNSWAKTLKLSAGGAIEFTGATRSFGLGATGGSLYFSTENVDGSGAANYFMIADANGNMSIGNTVPSANYKLAVEGTIGARRIKVVQTGWPDYVFHGDYQLPSLQEVEDFVTTRHHLPGIPSEKEVTADGLDLGDFDKQLLKKVEELTLYIIQLNKNVDNLNKKVAAQQEVIAELTKK